jgi:hypothetical protein
LASRQRVKKTLERNLSDLDDHLYLLEDQLRRLGESDAHIKVIAAELRVLICFSSGTEGLLWRLADELGVSVEVTMFVPENLDPTLPLSVGLIFSYGPIETYSSGDPLSVPRNYSFREVIKKHEPVFISGKGITHEYLIKAIAQQMGTAHEDEGIELSLLEMESIFVRGVNPYIPILKTDAELVLQMGSRILREANRSINFVRKPRRFSVSSGGVLQGRSGTAKDYAGDFEQTGSSIEVEGTMAFRLIHENPDWATDNNTYAFGEIQKSSVRIDPTKRPPNIIELKVKGICGKNFTRNYPAFPCDERGLRVAISWKTPKVKIYMNEQHVETFDAK